MNKLRNVPAEDSGNEGTFPRRLDKKKWTDISLPENTVHTPQNAALARERILLEQRWQEVISTTQQHILDRIDSDPVSEMITNLALRIFNDMEARNLFPCRQENSGTNDSEESEPLFSRANALLTTMLDEVCKRHDRARSLLQASSHVNSVNPLHNFLTLVSSLLRVRPILPVLKISRKGSGKYVCILNIINNIVLPSLADGQINDTTDEPNINIGSLAKQYDEIIDMLVRENQSLIPTIIHHCKTKPSAKLLQDELSFIAFLSIVHTAYTYNPDGGNTACTFCSAAIHKAEQIISSSRDTVHASMNETRLEDFGHVPDHRGDTNPLTILIARERAARLHDILHRWQASQNPQYNRYFWIIVHTYELLGYQRVSTADICRILHEKKLTGKRTKENRPATVTHIHSLRNRALRQLEAILQNKM